MKSLRMKETSPSMVGTVVKGIGGFYYVWDGADTYMGKARGNLKRNKELIYVGDIVDFDLDDNSECIINAVTERNNYLTRPPVSNLEMLVVVFAAAEPDVNFPVIDKLTAACVADSIECCICITKKDIVSNEYLEKLTGIYGNIFKTVAINGHSGEGTDELLRLISGRRVALAGPSGVGKSTITNILVGETLAETGSISDKTARGKHTTRHVQIYPLPDGTMLYDTPGFTSLDAPATETSAIQNLFPEFGPFKQSCRYADCIHINEPDCAVKEALDEGNIAPERYNSYIMMTEEVKKWQK